MALQLQECKSTGLREPRHNVDTDMRRLACGILRQALRDIVGPQRTCGARREWQEDAIRWIFSDDRHPGSYWWVCAIVGLDTSVFRQWLFSYDRSHPMVKGRKARSMLSHLRRAFR